MIVCRGRFRPAMTFGLTAIAFLFSLPVVYQFSSFWSSQAGSLLLWGLVLTGLLPRTGGAEMAERLRHKLGT